MLRPSNLFKNQPYQNLNQSQNSIGDNTLAQIKKQASVINTSNQSNDIEGKIEKISKEVSNFILDSKNAYSEQKKDLVNILEKFVQTQPLAASMAPSSLSSNLTTSHSSQAASMAPLSTPQPFLATSHSSQATSTTPLLAASHQAVSQSTSKIPTMQSNTMQSNTMQSNNIQINDLLKQKRTKKSYSKVVGDVIEKIKMLYPSLKNEYFEKLYISGEDIYYKSSNKYSLLDTQLYCKLSK